MPSQLAFLLFLMFIGWLLYQEFRSQYTVSPALWIPTAWLLIVSSRPLTVWYVGYVINDPGEYLEGSPLDMFFYLVLIIAGFTVLTCRGVRWGEIVRQNKWIFLLYFYLANSVFWSDYSFISFKRLFKDFGVIVMVLMVLTETDPLGAIRAVFMRCASVLIPLSVLFIKYFPQLGRAYTREGRALYTGVTTQKNTLGELVMVCGLFLVWDYLESRRTQGGAGWWRVPWDRLLVGLMAAWLLTVSESQTALLCLSISLAILLFGRWLASRKAARLLLFVALSMPFLLYLTQGFQGISGPLVQLLGRNVTFTGRTDLWRLVLAQPVNPLIGTGYYSFWLGNSARKVWEGFFQVNTAHNGYLEMFLDGGLLGVGLLMLMLLINGLRLANLAHATRYQRVQFAFLIAAILYNLSESMYGRLSLVWFTTLLVLIRVPQLDWALARSREDVETNEATSNMDDGAYLPGVQAQESVDDGVDDADRREPSATLP